MLRSDLAANVKHPPNDVTVELAGNSWTACMNDPSTGEPYPIGSPGFLARYAADIQAIATTVASVHARLLFIAPPPSKAAWYAAVEQQLIGYETATGNPVSYGPADAIAPGWSYAQTLPCSPKEAKSRKDGCAAGQILVRTAGGGLHMCPVGFDFSGLGPPCPVYSSGELRWATAYAATVSAAFS